MSDYSESEVAKLHERADEVRIIPVRGGSGPNTAFITRDPDDSTTGILLLSANNNVVDMAQIDECDVEEWLANREDW